MPGKTLEFNKESMSGAITEPRLIAAYAELPSSVGNELIRLNNFAEDYAL